MNQNGRTHREREMNRLEIRVATERPRLEKLTDGNIFGTRRRQGMEPPRQILWSLTEDQVRETVCIIQSQSTNLTSHWEKTDSWKQTPRYNQLLHAGPQIQTVPQETWRQSRRRARLKTAQLSLLQDGNMGDQRCIHVATMNDHCVWDLSSRQKLLEKKKLQHNKPWNTHIAWKISEPPVTRRQITMARNDPPIGSKIIDDQMSA